MWVWVWKLYTCVWYVRCSHTHKHTNSQTQSHLNTNSIYWIAMVLVQVGWSFAFAKENIPLSMAFMLAIFLTLLALNLSLQRVFDRRPASALEYWVRACVGKEIYGGMERGWMQSIVDDGGKQHDVGSR